MKTFVITLSKAFMIGHPKDGMPTGFEEAIKDKRKIHTLRCNFSFWENRIREIQDGRALLSIRQWTRKPYRSKQREIAQLIAKDGIGLQKVIISRSEWEDYDHVRHFCYWATIDGTEVELEDIARNDGFTDCHDFIAWFDHALNNQQPDEDGWRHLELAIIHFTPFRYQRI